MSHSLLVSHPVDPQALGWKDRFGGEYSSTTAMMDLVVKKLPSLPPTRAKRLEAIAALKEEGAVADEWTMGKTLLSAGIGNTAAVVVVRIEVPRLHRAPFSFSPALAGPGLSVSKDGMEVSMKAGVQCCTLGTGFFHSGVHYWEIHVLETEPNAGHISIGIVDSSRGSGEYPDTLHRRGGGECMGLSMCSWRGFFSYKEGPAWGNHYGPGECYGY